MNKTDLIAAVAERSGLQKKDTEKIVSSVFDIIVDTLASGEKVQIAGFGIFEVRERSARIGRNPRTKEPIKIEASKLPVFKAGSPFKKVIDDKK